MSASDLRHCGDSSCPDAQRNFTLRSQRIYYAVFSEAIRRISRLHDRGINAGTAEGLLIIGQSGGGKTAIADFYVSKFPRVQSETGLTIPVLRVDTPESPSVKTFAQQILIALGDPAADRGTAETKTQRLIVLLEKCKVQLLIVDEFQHFFDGHRASEARRITDWLKNLLNRVRIPVVLFGLPRSIVVLRLNPQLRRRFASPHYLRPFSLADGEFAELRSVLKTFHDLIKVPCVPLHDVDVARRFFYASNGLIDYVVKVLDEAVSTSCLKEGERLDLPHFARAFKSVVWGDVPPRLNPFSNDAIHRPLIKRGEPFDNWDDPKAYSSSTVRSSNGSAQ
jgi:hypothetical protein